MCPLTGLYIVVIGIVAVAVMSQWFSRTRSFQKLGLSAGPFASIAGKTGQGVHNGVTYGYQYVPPSKNNPAKFYVRIPCVSNAAFEIGKEGGTDRFFKSIGISTEIQTGDDDFDRSFYVVTEQSDFASQFLRDPARRETVRKIFSAGFTQVRHDGKKMEAVWRSFDPARVADQNFVLETVEQLSGLTENLPAVIQSVALSAVPIWKFCCFASFSVAILSAVAGFVFLIWFFSSYDVFDQGLLFRRSLQYSVPAFLVFVVLSIFFLKGRSSSHRELTAIFFIALFSFPLAGFSLLGFLNGYLDQGVVSTHSTVVLGKWSTRHKNSTSYHVSVGSWRGRGAENLSISYSEYTRLVPQQTRISVQTKPGRFSFEWLVSQRIEG